MYVKCAYKFVVVGCFFFLFLIYPMCTRSRKGTNFDDRYVFYAYLNRMLYREAHSVIFYVLLYLRSSLLLLYIDCACCHNKSFTSVTFEAAIVSHSCAVLVSFLFLSPSALCSSERCYFIFVFVLFISVPANSFFCLYLFHTLHIQSFILCMSSSCAIRLFCLHFSMTN